jgi:hypothetical protein
MHFLLMIWIGVCAAGAALSVKSVIVLGARSPLTRLGWFATALYFAIEACDAVRAKPAPAHADYLALALLTVAFVAAGVRDEPQAEPWWWPTGTGLTGRERRAHK